jgi:hypothetical protein
MAKGLSLRTWTQSEPPRGSGWVHAQHFGIESTAYPPATAGGSDCIWPGYESCGFAN